MEAAIAKISHNDILEILKDKTVRHIWKFLCLGVILLLHICIICVIYSPLEGDYSILLSKVQMVLREGSKQRPKEFYPIPFSDFHMRVFLTDLNNFWLSQKTATSKPLKIFQVHFQNEYLRPITNNMIEIKNVELIRNRWGKHDFESVAPFRYKDYTLKTSEKVRISSKKPKDFRDYKFFFEGLGFNKTIPKLNYRFDPDFQSFIVDLDYNDQFADPFYIKIVGDNTVGPYTHKVSTKCLMYNTLTKFYVLAEVQLVRDMGDSYNIHFHYHQLSTHDMIKKYLYLFPVAVVIKSILMATLLYRSARKIWRTNYEYNLWYKIAIKNDLPEYLMRHRTRKMPDFLRRFKHLINIDDMLLWFSTIFFAVFWVYFCFQLLDKEDFMDTVHMLKRGEINPEKVYFNGLSLAKIRFKMNFFAGFEVLLLTFAVLLSLRRINMFKVILESFYIIFSNLAALIIISVA